MLHGFLHRGPGVEKELRVGLPREDEITPNQKYILAVQILPVTRILPAELVDLYKRILIGHPQIMRDRALRLAYAESKLPSSFRLPLPSHLLRYVLRHRGSKLTHHLLV